MIVPTVLALPHCLLLWSNKEGLPHGCVDATRLVDQMAQNSIAMSKEGRGWSIILSAHHQRVVCTSLANMNHNA